MKMGETPSDALEEQRQVSEEKRESAEDNRLSREDQRELLKTLGFQKRSSDRLLKK